jgi:protein-disulfide isomerase
VGKYHEVADALFKNQTSWAMSGNVWGAISAVLTPAEQKKVLSLVKDPGVKAEIDAEYQEGVASNVNETPTLILTAGGKRYNLPRAPDYRLLKQMIDGFLTK